VTRRQLLTAVLAGMLCWAGLILLICLVAG
jgi:hypothetical protein